jgi:protein-S-isoprenylcysteine O-methyltransferase Ste14
MSQIALIQILYLAAFAAFHSLLASLPAKRLAWRVFGRRMDPWYLRVYSIAAALLLLPLLLLVLLFPGRRLYTVPSPWRWLMVGIQLLAGITTVKAFTDAPHRFSIAQQLKKDADLQPLGPRGVYCWMRDPFLFSGLLQIWLTPFMTARLLILYVLASLYLFLGSLHWESRLAQQFGDEYRAYVKRVPRLVPFKGKVCGKKRSISSNPPP